MATMWRAFTVILSLSVLLLSCSLQSEDERYSFYHWKAKANYPEVYQNALEIANTRSIYVHYFDVELIYDSYYDEKEVYPNYVVKEINKAYQAYDIVPVIYITNEVLQFQQLEINRLAERIIYLTHQISESHFGKKINTIQLDCDWTKSTQANYFELLKLLKVEFEIDVTIRLHQIKFQEKTGVPPVNSGTLMLYNMGDLKKKNENSILESNIVSQYIHAKSTYPIPLNVALPLFSQTVLFNQKDQVKLIRNAPENLENDPNFRRLDDMNFEVLSDTLYKGFYLSKGHRLKAEIVRESEVVKAYHTVKNSQLNLKETIFYHLDEASLNKINLKEILEQL